MTLLPKRPQFAETIRLLRKGVNVRDFYYFSRKQNRAFALAHPYLQKRLLLQER